MEEKEKPSSFKAHGLPVSFGPGHVYLPSEVKGGVASPRISSWPSNKMPLRFGKDLYTITGGPWVSRPAGYKGVCMAAEADINSMDGAVKVHTPDFGTPNTGELFFGLKVALAWLLRGENVYVGCGAGRGRTGLFLASLAKISLRASDSRNRLNPIEYVRVMYNPLAVENKKQEDFVRELNVRSFIAAMDDLISLVKFI